MMIKNPLLRKISLARYRRKHYLINKSEIISRQNKLRAITKERMTQLFNNRCKKCNLVFPPICFDFHHLDPSKKDLGISKLKTYRWERILAELKKCIMVCANCHRLIHEELGWNPMNKTNNVSNSQMELYSCQVE